MHSGHASTTPVSNKPQERQPELQSVGAHKRQRLSASAGVSSKTLSSNVNSSCLDHLHQQGSARIRFPNTDTDALDAVLMNTAGGLTGDDHVQWKACAGVNSRLSISTAACEKIYRTHGPAARQSTQLNVEDDARMDWLPQESIVFDGAALKRSLDVHVALSAQALLVETLVLGRQAMNETFNSINVHDRWRIYRDGTLLHAEDFRLNTAHQPGGLQTSATEISNEFENFALQQGVLHHYRATTTVIFVSFKSPEYLYQQVERIRALACAHTLHVNAAASVMKNRIVLRVLARNSFELRKFLIPCIEYLSDGAPIPPVWNV